jgi:hypothetical protein
MKEATFCLTPPILNSQINLVSITYIHSPVPDLAATIRRRILKTSKGLAIQKYLSLNVSGRVDTLWVVSMIDFFPGSDVNKFPLTYQLRKSFKVSPNIPSIFQT